MGPLLPINIAANAWRKYFLVFFLESCMNDILLNKQKILCTQLIPVMKKWLYYPWKTKIRRQCVIIKQHCKQWLSAK